MSRFPQIEERVIQEVPASRDGEGLPLRKLLSAVMRSRLFIVTLTGLAVMVGLWIALGKPNTYVSRGAFLVRRGGESISVDPMANAGEESPRFSLRQNAPSVLYSDALFRRVVERLGPDFILMPYEPPGVDSEVGDGSLFSKLHESMWNLQRLMHSSYPESASKADAVLTLQENLEITVPTLSDVLEVAYYANDPLRAQRILEVFMQEARKRHLEAYNTDPDMTLIEEAYQESKLRFETEQTALDKFLRDEVQVDNFELELEAATTALAQARSDANRLSEKLQGARFAVKALNARIEGLTRTKMSDEVVFEPNPAIAALRSQIDDVDKQLLSMRHLKPGDAKLDGTQKARRALVERLNQELQNPVLKREQKREIENPEYTAARLQRDQLATDILADEQTLIQTELRAGRATDRFNMLARRRQAFHDLDNRVDKLRRDFEQADYRRTLSKKKQRLNAELVSSLVVLSEPNYPLIKDGPERGKIIAAALFLGLVISLGVVVLRAMTDTTIRTPEDLEQLTGETVLAVVPSLESKTIRRHNKLGVASWN